MLYKLYCLVLLISCVSHTAHSGGIRELLFKNEASQERLEPEPPVPLEITSVVLTHNADGGTLTTSLSFCSVTALLDESLETLTEDTLVLIIDSDPIEVNTPGTMSSDYLCANFDMKEQTLSADLEMYGLNFQVTEKSTLAVVDKTASVTFAMTVTANTLICKGVSFVRAERTDGTSVFPTPCLALANAEQSVCYRNGDLQSNSFCFTRADSIPVSLSICLGGANSIAVSEDTSTPQVNDLNYGDGVTGILSLTVLNAHTTFEALIQKDTESSYIPCFAGTTVEGTGECNIVASFPGTAVYTACSILVKDDGARIQTITTTLFAPITDMNVNAYEDTTNDLLQFRFAHTNTDVGGSYIATFNGASGPLGSPVTLDCSALALGSTCYGFVHLTDIDPSIVGYLEIDYIPSSNKIHYPISLEPQLRK